MISRIINAIAARKTHTVEVANIAVAMRIPGNINSGKRIEMMTESQLVGIIAACAKATGGDRKAVARVITNMFASDNDSFYHLLDGLHCRVDLARKTAAHMGI